jgi:hypothetical protein
MAPYMDPLIRSGAVWSCGRTAATKSRPGFWSRIWRWFVVRRHTQSGILVRSEWLIRGKPRY